MNADFLRAVRIGKRIIKENLRGREHSELYHEAANILWDLGDPYIESYNRIMRKVSDRHNKRALHRATV